MFQNSYQSGPCLQVFDSKGYSISQVNREKNQFYQQLCKPSKQHAFQRIFDKQMRGYLLQIQGHNNKFIMPKDQHKQLCLMQQFLVLQIFVNQNQPFSIELTVTDTTKTKRRIILTSAFNRIEKKFFHVKYPIDQIRKGLWLNLSIDVYSFMAAFKGQTFRSLDQIAIGSSCRLKRIFTMRQPLIQISNQFDQYADRHVYGVFVPKQYGFPLGTTFANQLLSYRQQLYDQKQIKMQYYEKYPLKEIRSMCKESFKEGSVANSQNSVEAMFNYKGDEELLKQEKHNKKNKERKLIGIRKEPFLSDLQATRNMKLKEIQSNVKLQSKNSKIRLQKQKEEIKKKDQEQIKKNHRKLQEELKKIQMLKEADRKRYQGKKVKTRKQIKKLSSKQKNNSQYELKKQTIMPLLKYKNSMDPNNMKLDQYQHQPKEQEFVQQNQFVKKRIQQIQKNYQKFQSPRQYQDHLQEHIQETYNEEEKISQEIAKSNQQFQINCFDSLQDNKSYLKNLKQMRAQLEHNTIKLNQKLNSQQTLITKKNKQSIAIIGEDNKLIEVVYYPELKCYYNQQSNTYYDIKE